LRKLFIFKRLAPTISNIRGPGAQYFLYSGALCVVFCVFGGLARIIFVSGALARITCYIRGLGVYSFICRGAWRTLFFIVGCFVFIISCIRWACARYFVYSGAWRPQFLIFGALAPIINIRGPCAHYFLCPGASRPLFPIFRGPQGNKSSNRVKMYVRVFSRRRNAPQSHKIIMFISKLDSVLSCRRHAFRSHTTIYMCFIIPVGVFSRRRKTPHLGRSRAGGSHFGATNRYNVYFIMYVRVFSCRPNAFQGDKMVKLHLEICLGAFSCRQHAFRSHRTMQIICVSSVVCGCVCGPMEKHMIRSV